MVQTHKQRSEFQYIKKTQTLNNSKIHAANGHLKITQKWSPLFVASIPFSPSKAPHVNHLLLHLKSKDTGNIAQSESSSFSAHNIVYKLYLRLHLECNVKLWIEIKAEHNNPVTCAFVVEMGVAVGMVTAFRLWNAYWLDKYRYCCEH